MGANGRVTLEDLEDAVQTQQPQTSSNNGSSNHNGHQNDPGQTAGHDNTPTGEAAKADLGTSGDTSTDTTSSTAGESTPADDTPPPKETRKGTVIGGVVLALVLSLMVAAFVHALDSRWPIVVGVIILCVIARVVLPKVITSPPDRPVPKTGGQVRLYKFLNNPVVGINYRPRLSKAEQAMLEEEERTAQQRRITQLADEAFRQRTAYLIARLRLLAKLGIQPTISFCNIKSGSKTTVAVYVGSVIAEYTRKNALLLPATQNTATSTAGVVSGIDEGNLITVSELSADIDKYGAYRVVSSRLPLTKHGLAVVCEDANSVIAGDEEAEADYAKEQFDKIVRTLYPNLDVLILDHGNDDIRRNSIVLSAVRFSDGLNFVSMAPTPISIKTMGQTIDGYNTDTITQSNSLENSLPGEAVSTREKVQHSIIAISGMRSVDNVDIDDLTSNRLQSVQDDTPPQWDGKGFYVPYDPYIASEEVSVCDLDKIQPETLQAFLEIAVANYEEAARVQRIPIPAPQSKTPPPAALATTTEGASS